MVKTTKEGELINLSIAEQPLGMVQLNTTTEELTDAAMAFERWQEGEISACETVHLIALLVQETAPVALELPVRHASLSA